MGSSKVEANAPSLFEGLLPCAYVALGDLPKAVAIAEGVDDEGLKEHIAAFAKSLDGRTEDGIGHVNPCMEP